MQRMLDLIAWLPTHWNPIKTFIEHAFGFSHNALHVEAGVCLQILFAFALRRSLGSWRPWLVVLGLESANEWSDLTLERWPDLAMQWGESAKDMLLTMFLPTLLLCLVRFCPRLFAAEPSAPSSADIAAD